MQINYCSIQPNCSFKWEQFGFLKPKLCKIFFRIVELCSEKNIEVIITSGYRKKTNDSGIHELCRAIDFILSDNSDNVVDWLLSEINDTYVYDFRRPNIQTLIWHKVKESNWHFHLQIL